MILTHTNYGPMSVCAPPSSGRRVLVMRWWVNYAAMSYRALGHSTQVYSFDDLPEWISEKVKKLIFPYFVARCVGRLSRNRKFDVVDASSGDAWIRGIVSSNSRSPLLVTRSHGLEHTAHLEQIEEARLGNLSLSWKYPLYHVGPRLWEVATSLRHPDLTLFLNHSDLNYAVRELGIKPERAKIVTNGIPEAFLSLPLQTTPMAQETPIHIAQVGSYIPGKGTHYAAPALNRILSVAWDTGFLLGNRLHCRSRRARRL
jgi:hypothetical protein